MLVVLAAVEVEFMIEFSQGRIILHLINFLFHSDKDKSILQSEERRFTTMLDSKVSKLLNEQIKNELFSAYLYLDFSLYYKEEGLDGFANWYMIQTQEERDHAMLMLQYLQNNGEHITLEAIEQPNKTIKALKDPIEMALEHERYITSTINNIYDAAQAVKDYRTMQFLDWFVKEQGEEEMNAEDMVKKIRIIRRRPS